VRPSHLRFEQRGPTFPPIKHSGIWTKHLKAKTNLHQTVIDRCLKTLIQKHLIKRVPSVQVFQSSASPLSTSSDMVVCLASNAQDLYAGRPWTLHCAHWWSLVHRQRTWYRVHSAPLRRVLQVHLRFRLSSVPLTVFKTLNVKIELPKTPWRTRRRTVPHL